MSGCIYRGIAGEKTARGGWVIYQTVCGVWFPGEFPTLASAIQAIDNVFKRTASR